MRMGRRNRESVQIPVEAGLLAKAECQLLDMLLTQCIREQARCHIFDRIPFLSRT